MIVYVNGNRSELAGNPTLAEAVAGPDGDVPRRGVAVALDGVVVPRARHAETRLHDGARIEIVTAVQGG